MKTSAYYRDQATANSLSNVRMSDYDRALAEHYLAQGTVVAEVMLRAAHGLRSPFVNASKPMTGVRLHLRV